MKLKSIKAAVVVLAVAVTGLSGCKTMTGSSDNNLPNASIREQSESLSASYAKMRSEQVSNITYALSIDLSGDTSAFKGATVIDFDMSKDNRVPLTIDFNKGSVASVEVNGQAVNFDYGQWFISLAPDLFKTGKNQVRVAFSRDYSTDGTGLHRFKDPEDGEVYIYTNFEPYDANKLFPLFDQPDLKASYRLDVKAPANWQVISVSREDSVREENGVKHWDFPVTDRISSYVFALHAGNFRVWEDQYQDIPLRLFARQSLAEYVKTEDWFTFTKQSFRFFNDYFGIPYPFIKYDQLIVPDFNPGAMENVAAVTFNEYLVKRGDKTSQERMHLANIIAHEMAHMWFGNLVTMDWWNGLWLNESFATYMAYLAVAEASEFDNVWDTFYSGTKQWAYRTDRSVNTHAIELPVPTTADALTNFDGITYGKGASVLKQIPKYLGEDHFQQGVSNYLKKFSYRNTSLEDFMGELGKAAGKDMKQWTRDWMFKTGLNTIEVDFSCEAGKVSHMSLHQSAPEGYPTLREQRVQLGLYQYLNGEMILSDAIPLVYKGALTDVSAALDRGCPDLVYPNLDDWGYVQVSLDNQSLATLRQRINQFESPTLRLMLWQSLFDSVQDAKLPADEYVEFALANIGSEPDYNVVRKVTGHLYDASHYLQEATDQGKADFSSRLADIEAFFYQQLQAAEVGSDIQKLWYSKFRKQAATAKSLQRLLDLLDGRISFTGLTIDQDKRWDIISSINKYQFANYRERLRLEIEEDGSDKGVKNSIYSEVVRPESEVKAKWFDVVVNNPDNLKLATLRSVMWGLFPYEQQSLRTSYDVRVKAQIAKLNEEGSSGLLSTFVRTMLPRDCTTANHEQLGALVDEYQTMKPQVVKTVRRTHQEVGRCVDVLALLSSDK